MEAASNRRVWNCRLLHVLVMSTASGQVEGADCQVVSRDKALQEMLSSWIQNETMAHRSSFGVSLCTQKTRKHSPLSPPSEMEALLPGAAWAPLTLKNLSSKRQPDWTLRILLQTELACAPSTPCMALFWCTPRCHSIVMFCSEATQASKL